MDVIFDDQQNRISRLEIVAVVFDGLARDFACVKAAAGWLSSGGRCRASLAGATLLVAGPT